MQKNWYIVYTRPKCEKKVAALLTRRKIKNFYPVNYQAQPDARRNKLTYQPLFNCYVFVHIADAAIDQLKRVDKVVNIVYWKNKPAIVKENEIAAIKDFTARYPTIRLEPISVNMNDYARIIEGASYTIDGKVVSVKNKSIKVNLPSLGFIMIAEMDKDSIIGREVSIGDKKVSLQ